jgi:hypothetical protein
VRVTVEADGVSRREGACITDLGCSSNYSNEIL